MLISGGHVLRADLKTCRPADVLIEDGFIRAIEPPGQITRGNLKRIEASDRLLVPGLVNGHTHGHGGLGKGAVADRVPLEVFLSASGAINGSRTIEDKRLSHADRGRIGAQGLHCRLRPFCRIPGTFARRHGCGGRGLW